MVSQLCFNPDVLVSWLRRVRGEGIMLPLHIGLAAPMQVSKLLKLGPQIGVGSSVRYLAKQHGFIGNVLKGGALPARGPGAGDGRCGHVTGAGDRRAAPVLVQPGQGDGPVAAEYRGCLFRGRAVTAAGNTELSEAEKKRARTSRPP